MSNFKRLEFEMYIKHHETLSTTTNWHDCAINIAEYARQDGGSEFANSCVSAQVVVGVLGVLNSDPLIEDFDLVAITRSMVFFTIKVKQ